MKMDESTLQKAVIELAQRHGWKVMHPLPGRTKKGWSTATQGDGRGYPDLTLVRERLMWVELKAEGKYLSAEQKMWRDWIIAAGGEWHLIRPLQWFDGTVDRVLADLLGEPGTLTDALSAWDQLVTRCEAAEADAKQLREALSEIECTIEEADYTVLGASAAVRISRAALKEQP